MDGTNLATCVLAGVTPMIQALHAILGSDQENKRPKVTMLYGSRVSDDILGQELLHKWAQDHPDQFTLVDVLSEEPTESDWKGARGYVDKAMIEQYFSDPSAATKFQIFVCGPPPMYKALCGPREDKEVKGLLGDMGYTPDQVYKF
jgi:cytochrome-b5 reductase